MTVVYARGTGSYDAAAKDAWERLFAWVSQYQARRQAKRGFGLFHDNPQLTPTELLRYDACIELATGPDADLPAGIGRQTLSGGTYAVHTHVGGYGAVGGLLSDLHREWVPRQGLAVDYDRPFMAIYLNDPLVTREVHRRTELCIPVLPLRTAMPGEASTEDGDFSVTAMRKAVGQA